jgi:hypothetical protein
MQRAAIFVSLLLATITWASPNSDEYSISVHVSSSNWVMRPSTSGPLLFQKLNVIIDGKKYELEATTRWGNTSNVPVLALGDYKAKLVQDEHKNAYEFAQTYEFLFPDKKTRKFIVMGQTE